MGSLPPTLAQTVAQQRQQTVVATAACSMLVVNMPNKGKNGLTMVLATSNSACCLQADPIPWADPLPLGVELQQHGVATCQQ